MKIGFKVLLGTAYLACLVDLTFLCRSVHFALTLVIVIVGALCGMYDAASDSEEK
jgi:hypothetical protein